jgi:hypothetical protein
MIQSTEKKVIVSPHTIRPNALQARRRLRACSSAIRPRPMSVQTWTARASRSQSAK